MIFVIVKSAKRDGFIHYILIVMVLRFQKRQHIRAHIIACHLK